MSIHQYICVCIHSLYLILGWYCVFTGRWWPWSSAQNRGTGLGAGCEPALNCSIKTALVQQLHVKRSSLSATWHWGWKQRFHTFPFLLSSNPRALQPSSSYIHLGPLLCWQTRSVSQKMNCVSYRQSLPLMPSPCRILSWVSWRLSVQWYWWNSSGTTLAVKSFCSVSSRTNRNTFFIPWLLLHLCSNGERDQTSKIMSSFMWQASPNCAVGVTKPVYSRVISFPCNIAQNERQEKFLWFCQISTSGVFFFLVF